MPMISNDELLKMFEENMHYDGLSTVTINHNLDYVGKFLAAVDKPAAEITSAVIKSYMRNLKKQNGEEMNVSTKQAHQSCIKNFFNFLYNSDEPEIEEMLMYVTAEGHRTPRKNPVENLKAILTGKEAKSKRNERKEGLTREEASLLLETILNVAESKKDGSAGKVMARRDFAMTLLMLELGLRSADVIALNKSNFDIGPEKQKVTYIAQKTKDAYTRNISKELADALMLYWDIRNDDDDIAFSSSYNKCVNSRMSNHDINDNLKKYTSMAGIEKKVTCHILRHTCGALVYENSGGDIMLTKEVLGHKSINVTQIYAVNSNINNKVTENTISVTNKLMANF